LNEYEDIKIESISSLLTYVHYAVVQSNSSLRSPRDFAQNKSLYIISYVE